MKKIITPLFIALAAATGVQANAAVVNTFKVVAYNIIGYEVLPANVLSKINKALEPFKGSNQTVQSIVKARATVQDILDTDTKGEFSVNIPAQTIVDDLVLLNIVRTRGEVTFKGTPDFPEDNVRRSLPSLKNGLTLDNGVSNLDPTQLTLAQQNPAKITSAKYLINGVNPIKLEVTARAPYGKYISIVQADNYGAESQKYGRWNYTFIDGNVSGIDDQLFIYFSSSFKKPKDSLALSARYTLPFYEISSRLDLYASYSKGYSKRKIDTLDVELNANGAALGASFSKITSAFDSGRAIQNIVSVGYTLQKAKSVATSDGLNENLTDNSFKIAPIYIENRLSYIPTNYLSVFANVKFTYIQAGVLGTDKLEKIQGTRKSVGEKQHIFNYEFKVVKKFKNGGVFTAAATGVYSQNPLMNNFQKSLGGANFGSVRGFRNLGGGDKVNVFNFELATKEIQVVDSLVLSGYAFYDYGTAYKNWSKEDIEPSVKASSIGIGVKGYIQPGFKYNTFLAYKLLSADKDVSGLTKKPLGKLQFFTQVSYTF